jgi:hypothetical protein
MQKGSISLDEYMKATKLKDDEIKSLYFSVAWHKERWETLQAYQHCLPEPYRTEICDILANGSPRSVGGTTLRAVDVACATPTKSLRKLFLESVRRLARSRHATNA